MSEEFEVVRVVGEERRVGKLLSEVSRHWQGSRECFMMISPHDDDVVIGGGLLIQLAQREKVPVYVVIVTDGSMGYCSLEDKERISQIRKEEAYNCYTLLGIPRENIIWLGYPDCRLNFFKGRFSADSGAPDIREGFTGLQNSFTYWLRKIRPTQCFVPTINDLHPDHKIVYEELLISIFHSSGSIWPELGEPLERPPYVIDLAVYCDFPSSPTVRIKAPDEALDKKLAGIAAFKSQRQIGAVVDIIRKNGPYEYLRGLDFNDYLYNPQRYYQMFEEYKHIAYFGHR